MGDQSVPVFTCNEAKQNGEWPVRSDEYGRIADMSWGQLARGGLVQTIQPEKDAIMDAIQTRYKNYYFRSRTEARWAVFFDSLRVEWEYEEQGFRLQDGALYLPDFWLPQPDLWVEVKGTGPNDEEANKAQRLADESQHRVLLVAGPPQDPKYRSERHLLYRPDMVPTFANIHELFGFKSPRAAGLLAAYGEAMSARFEHGESPRARYLNR